MSVMMYEYIFGIIAVVEIASATGIFLFRDVMHSALALAIMFLVNSAAFMALGEPLLAIIQLFILVGGVATYLFVGVASDHQSERRHTNFAAFSILSILVFAFVAYPYIGYFTGSPSAQLTASSISAEFSSGYQLLYVLVILLFGSALGSILLLKSAGEKRRV
jgi:NADH:ubiquinone oxidoreductase subunit 6 (subunit J)